ncbi:putative 5-amino-6-(5-phosphoribosylamino)uracil reductase [Mycobacterium xenopi 3993]|nr:putative 5-amino-6-(5-phosphoribosylamino)uracil reductase [Mycobacterium xenopi 3993]
MQPGAVAAWCNHAHARPDRRCSPGLRLTLLGSVREVDDGDLPELYGYPPTTAGSGCGRTSSRALTAAPRSRAPPAGWVARRPGTVQHAARAGRRRRGRRGHRADRELQRRPADRGTAAVSPGPRALRGSAAGDRHPLRSPRPRYAGVHPHRGTAAGAHLHRGPRRDAAATGRACRRRRLLGR